jgi:hypothetical protein
VARGQAVPAAGAGATATASVRAALLFVRLRRQHARAALLRAHLVTAKTVRANEGLRVMAEPGRQVERQPRSGASCEHPGLC